MTGIAPFIISAKQAASKNKKQIVIKKNKSEHEVKLKFNKGVQLALVNSRG